MKIFKVVNINGSYTNNTDKYQLLIHFQVSQSDINLLDENGIIIERYGIEGLFITSLNYPQITGQENLSTGAISYNPFTVDANVSYGSFKRNMTKILIPPHFTVQGISTGLFIELDNLEELRGLL